MLKEAEVLMKKLSNHPQFLVQLFRHAATITQDTDQQVALDLLRELSCHRLQQMQNRLEILQTEVEEKCLLF